MAATTYEFPQNPNNNYEDLCNRFGELIQHLPALGLRINSFAIIGNKLRVIVDNPIRADHVTHWNLTQVI